MNNTFDKDDFNGPEFKPLRLLFGIFIVLFISYLVYKQYVLSYSDFRYTIGVISGTYSDSKTVGKWYSFSVDGEIITHSCTSNPCKLLGDNSRFIVKYFPGHPDVSELMLNYPVKADIDAPDDGWVEIPQSLFNRGK